jgi:hypothetical protein
MNQFYRKLEPLDAMNIGNPNIKTQISRILQRMHKDYQETNIIAYLNKYELTPAYLRKIVGSQIIIRMTKSKKNMHYKWNGGDNPDYSELADKVLAYSTHTKAVKNETESFYTAKMSLLLFKNGVQEDKIPQLTQEIIKLFFNE